MSDESESDKTTETKGTNALARGTAIGVALHDIAVGAGIGLTFGAAIGLRISRKHRSSADK